MSAKHDCGPEKDEIGRRLLLNHIDKCASNTPDRIAFYQTILEPKEKVIPLTYANLRNLVDQLAWWLNSFSDHYHTGKERITAYLGPSDLRHFLVALACNRIGSKALLLSPRNNAHIHTHLINQCSCQILIFDHTCSHVVDQVSAKSQITRHSIDDLVDLLKKKGTHNKDFPYHETWENACRKTALIFQTSGSTSLPKAIPIAHSAIATIDIQQILSQLHEDGLKCHLEILIEAKRPYQSFPFFHVAGFELTSLFLFAGRSVILGPPHRPPGIEVYRKVVELARPDGALLAPQTLDDVAEDPMLISAVVPKLEWIMYGGVPVAKKTGNLISSRTRLMNGFGSTECGSMPLYPTHAPYWNCYHFHPLSGADLRPLSDSDDLYELFIVRNETCLPYQAIFQSFPELQEFPVNDVFRRHPENENYWIYQGRKDDIMLLSTGEKINPLPVQDAVTAIPGVRAALVVGNKQPYPGLLVELEFDAIFPDAKEVVIDRLDKKLAETNIQGSRDAHIQLKDVIWNNPHKPLARNPKGSLHRNSIERDYDDEITRLYEKEYDQLNIELDPLSEQTLFTGLLQMLGQLVSKDDLNIDDDLFENGLDSRGAQILTTAINRALFKANGDKTKDAQKGVPVGLAYKYPTVEKLGGALLQHLDNPEMEGETEEHEFHRLSEDHADSLSVLSPRNLSQNEPRKEKAHVLLMGSTGFIGSYVLDSLSRCPEVERIICLDRWTKNRAASSDSQTTVNGADVKYLLGNVDKEDFNLDRDICSTLLDSITVILHCQWPMNFNQPLSSFDPSIQGVENVIRFAHGAQHNPPIIFLSSVATVKQWDHSSPVPEKSLSDPRHAQTGYGQSKLLASQLLEEAGKSLGIRSSICRLGQVAGPVGRVVKQRMWPRTDWFPILLETSRSIGCVPDSLGAASRVDWIPVDKLAEVMAQLVISKHDVDSDIIPSTDFYHLVNPKPARYQDILPAILKRLEGEVKVVPLSEWVERLEKSTATARTSSNPGLALLSFFQDLKSTQGKSPVVLDTQHTEDRLPLLSKTGAVDGSWMETWLDQWDFHSRN